MIQDIYDRTDTDTSIQEGDYAIPVATSSVENTDSPPLGVSLSALLPFSRYLQNLAKDRCDERIDVPIIELAKQNRPNLTNECWGLPTSEDDLMALGLEKVKVIAKKVGVYVEKEKHECVYAWISKMLSPVRTTGEFCKFIMMQDTAPHSATDKASVSMSYVDYLKMNEKSYDDEGKPLWGPASHFIRYVMVR